MVVVLVWVLFVWILVLFVLYGWFVGCCSIVQVGF